MTSSVPPRSRRLTPATHLWLVAAVAAACLMAVSLNSLRVLKQRVVAEREARVRATVRTAWEFVARQGELAAAGTLPLEEAQRAATETLRALRHETNDYFWISGVDRRMVMHPAQPALEGKDLSEYRDPDGKRIFDEFVKVAESTPAREGFVTYHWPKPEGGAAVRKLAFVKLYDPWGWVIGSGTYLDDMDATLAAEARRVLAATAFVALVLCGAGAALAWNLKRTERLHAEQRRAEATVRRTDRALRALTNCNEALVRATDEQSLLEAICRIVVEVGGYRFAWVGFAEDDERKTVRPAAQAGIENGYIARADVVWDDTERGRGPVGRAIRTRQPAIVRDVASDRNFDPWRAEALKRGFRSILAVPLLADGKAFGALGIYGVEADRFDDADERKLLLELAEDLAYGIVALRGRAERARMTAQLMQADRLVAMGTLAAGVAHEINNPLTYVLSGLQYVEHEVEGVVAELGPGRLDEVRQVLREMNDGCGRIRQAVRELKGFSRSDEESRQPIDVQRVLDFSVRMAANEIRHRARLVKEYGATPPVEANEARLGQVFLNLLINAAQAIPDGAVERNEVRVATRTDAAGDAVVEIRDTGVGIAREDLARIFEPFYTTKPVGVGTGLGLSISLNVVRNLGGHIEVESDVGRGTTFRVTLPSARAALARGADLLASPRAPPPPLARVLAVDDEPYVARAVRRALAPDFEVVHEASASAALARVVSGERVDVVLCDVMMPEKSGVDLYHELVAVAPQLARRLAFLTGGGLTPATQEFLDATRSPVVEKPFDDAALRATVQRLLA